MDYVTRELFPIQPEPHYDIYTGRSIDNIQMLVTSIEFDEFVTEFIKLYFTLDGDFLHVEHCPPYKHMYIENLSRIEHIQWERQRSLQYVRQIGLITIEPINIKRFFLPEYKIGVQQYPDHLQKIIDTNAVHASTEEEFERLEDWYYSDYFIFWCQNDFWCNSDGLIIAS